MKKGKTMKNRIIDFTKRHFPAVLTGLLIAFTFSVTGLMIQCIRGNIENYNIIRPGSAVTDVNTPAMAIGEEYLVREYDGRIGVYVPGDTQPIRVIQVYVAYLPESDRVDLREGIYVTGALALEKILDDFRS